MGQGVVVELVLVVVALVVEEVELVLVVGFRVARQVRS